MDTQTEIYELLEPLVGTVGVELVDVEWTGSTLRVTVDQSEGVSTAKIVEVNRLISPVLDQHDPISNRYTLEVSSPGVERPLNRPKHYARAVGEQVLIKLVGQGNKPQPADETPIRRIKGTLISADTDTIIVAANDIDGVELVEEVEHRVELDQISKAKTVFEWGQSEKPGKKGPKKGSKPKSAQSQSAQSQSAQSQSAQSQSAAAKVDKPTAAESSHKQSEHTTKEVHNG